MAFLHNRSRWLIVSLLFAITVISYVDRAAISFAVPTLEKEFGFSSSSIGLILGAFGIGYAITAIIGGAAIDRLGARRTLGVSVFVWSCSMATMGAASGFLSLLFSRAALGVAEGPNLPALNGTIGRWLPVRERAVALSAALVAVPLALAVGAVALSNLISIFGWRISFYMLSCLGFLWLPVWILFARTRPEDSPWTSQAERDYIAAGQPVDKLAEAKGTGAELKLLLRSPTFWTNCWAYLVFAYFLFFFMSWLPGYLHKSHGLELQQIGLVSVLPWLAGAIAMVFVGRLSDATLARTGSLRRSRSLPIAITQFIAVVAIIPVALTSSLIVAICGITVAVAASIGGNPAYYAVVTDIAPRLSGTSLGIMTMFFAVAGIAAPTLTGFLVDATGSFSPAFMLMAGLALSSVIAVLIFHQPDRDVAAAQEAA
ncbi:MAG: MFS transporter [Pseudomonadota bacterium]